MSRLAIDGGEPVRPALLPYGRQAVLDEDIAEVVKCLRSDWLTTGPAVDALESALVPACGAKHVAVVSSGTAALHAAAHVAGLQPGDEAITPTLTFAATANCAAFCGATPVFCDVRPDTLLMDVESARERVNDHTRAILPVDYAGLLCDLTPVRELADAHGLTVIEDACHAIGARQEGAAADMRCFSFHPVKHIAMGEGGAVATNVPDVATALRRFRNHGITSDHRSRGERGAHFYEMVELGFNYRAPDILCALALSQLKRLDANLQRRREIADAYAKAFEGHPALQPPAYGAPGAHAWHLYVLRLNLERLTVDRDAVFRALRAEGIGVNVHYVPVHLHPFYRQCFGTGPGDCPVAEREYYRLLSLPMFHAMTDADVRDACDAVLKVVEAYAAD